MAKGAAAERGDVIESATKDPNPPGIGEDGYPYREWKVGGEVRRFSLKPYPEDERPLYWYPRGINQNMKWRSQERNQYGIQPVIQWERWIDGKFRPRNEWEEHMTRTWLSERKGGNPDRWKGINHPRPGGYWTCECGWSCNNWNVLEDHCRALTHQLAMSFS